MSNVIEVDFNNANDISYFVNDSGQISGVRMGSLAVDYNGENVCIGQLDGLDILNGLEFTIEQMNRFCNAWLALHDPEFKGDSDD